METAHSAVVEKVKVKAQLKDRLNLTHDIKALNLTWKTSLAHEKLYECHRNLIHVKLVSFALVR